MAWSGTGTAITGSGGSYAAPGYSVSEIEGRVAKACGLSTSDTDSLALIDEAITVAGQTAQTWEGRNWHWALGKNTFSTVDGTGDYALRTVNSSAMADLYAPTRVWVADDYQLGKKTYEQYQDWVVYAFAEGEPLEYALSGDLTMHLMPVPNAVYTITVAYLKRHSKISSGAGLLSVPAEFHRPVYVDGAVWLIKNDLNAGGLANAEFFIRAMQRMAAADPSQYYDVMNDGPLMTPADRKVFWTGNI